MPRVLIALLALATVVSIVLWRVAASRAERRASSAMEAARAEPAPSAVAHELADAPAPSQPAGREQPPAVEARATPDAEVPKVANRARQSEPEPEGLVLAGWVRDENGAPLAGVPVQGLSMTRSADGGFPPRREATSDGDGAFRIAGLVPGKLVLLVELEGHAPCEHRLDESESRFDLELVLPRGLSISGLVLWPDGRPAQARVEVTPPIQSILRRASSKPSVYSDANGRFEIGELGAGVYSVKAQATEDGQEPTLWTASRRDVPAGEKDLVLTLAATVALSGVVRDDRGPVQKFRLVVERVPDPSRPFKVDTTNQYFEDTGGRFEFGGLAPGDWEVTVYAGEHAQLRDVRVTLPAAPIELFVEREARVSGVVLDAAGAPSAGASVRAERPGAAGPLFLFTGKEAKTDERGAFELRELARGTVTLPAFEPSGAATEEQEHTLVAGETLVGIALRLPGGASLTGEVLGRDGRGLPDVEVSVSSLGGFDNEPVRTDAQGRFAESGLPVGEVSVRAEHDGLNLYQHVTLREGETTHVQLVAPASSPVRLTGQVFARGAGLAEMRLSVAEAGTSSYARTDANGAYELTLPGPGRCQLTISGNDLYLTTVFDVPPVTEHVADIMIPLGRVSGRVTSVQGPPLPGVKVSSRSLRRGEGLSGTAHTRTDAEGRYELDLLPGAHALEAGGPLFSRHDAVGAYVRARREPISVVENGNVTGIDFVLRPGGTLEGSVRDGAGAAVALATIWSFEQGGPSLVGSCGPDGAFRLVGLASGENWIGAAGRDGATREPVRVVIEVDGTARCELVLAPARSVHVRVRDSRGGAVECEIEVVDERDRRQAKGPPGRSSEARLGPLAAGRYRVRARLDERVAERVLEIAGAGSELELELVLE